MQALPWKATWILVYVLFSAQRAHANIPLPTLSALSVTGGMGIVVLSGGYLLVSLCEGLVLQLIFKQDWRSALRLAFGVNLATTLIGFALSFHPFEILALLVVLPCASHLMKKNLNWRTWIRIPTCLVTGGVFVAILIAFPNNSVPSLILQFYALLCFSFFLTIFFEMGLFAARVKPGTALRWSVVCNGVSYALLFGVMLVFGFRSAAVADTAAARTWVTMHDSRGLSRSEIVQRIEQVYLWEDSGKGWILRWNRGKHPIPYSELALVRRWAESGHTADAEALFKIVNRYRPPLPEEENERTEEGPWQETRRTIDRARNTGKAG